MIKRQKEILEKVSNILRESLPVRINGDNGRKVELTFPDDREQVDPEDLYCMDCGEVDTFIYEMVTQIPFKVDAGQFRYRLTPLDPGLEKNIMKYARTSFLCAGPDVRKAYKVTDKIKCGNCGSPHVSIYMYTLMDCIDKKCEGCFNCGGQYGKDWMMETCVDCVQFQHSVNNNGIFWSVLDLDLMCESCPLKHLRLSYGITNLKLKSEASGRLIGGME